MRYLTVEEIIATNFFIIEKYSPREMKGVKEKSLLESAVYRPQQSLLGEDAYPTIFEKAAALFESLAKNHCFHNANKRTAFVALIQFLKYNGYRFVMPKDEAIEFVVDVVNHQYSFNEIVATIKEYTVKC
ncbi:type II toxin-antitoxin system death-on-curing family toxin [Anoxybacillus ayderensis]|uniref:type II toxin-antitoxin system death-on-curing family toxin n=1 Tax=Anoxybacillus TaxID=150247 RepID=UPI0002F442AB|nr:type II toxin-antitoxin system death-on-curing family toxin [Anoxybacillus sp. MB8]AXM87773.1 type II toxin-antitoxin system death-on-curing family toxin [Anoxybacillus ayderensis G10]MBW9218505.1 type II toxin-antitoxin system death-on-curing family toxin [Anoxybacillus sp. ST70]MCQ5365742.1 type II toxin-antitoxin system death-on-curing family toxin [Anoxybacillus gonensis]THD16218.1 type II toxin-antitoxin system death-on-curing family toxin [Anoxybacillus ayderensis]